MVYIVAPVMKTKLNRLSEIMLMMNDWWRKKNWLIFDVYGVHLITNRTIFVLFIFVFAQSFETNPLSATCAERAFEQIIIIIQMEMLIENVYQNSFE